MAKPAWCYACGEQLPKYLLDRAWEPYCSEWCRAFDHGAAVAFGLMGMAEAIREHDLYDRCVCCGAWAHCAPSPDLSRDTCVFCGGIDGHTSLCPSCWR